MTKHVELIAQLQTMYSAYVQGNHRELCEALKQAADALQASDSTGVQEDDVYAEDKAVDSFAKHMKYKLDKARKRGRSGWQDRAWTPEQISQALHEHVEKGDPVDVANYCMFLAARKEFIYPQPASEKPPHKCTWVEDAEGYYSTECGEAYVFNDGTPQQNGAYFCHHCGGKLITQDQK